MKLTSGDALEGSRAGNGAHSRARRAGVLSRRSQLIPVLDGHLASRVARRESMGRRGVRGWSEEACCPRGQSVSVFLSLPDYGDAIQLYTCLTCGAVFAVDPEVEHYSGPAFSLLKRDLVCPECSASLAGAVPYPEQFVCPCHGERGSYVRIAREYPAHEPEVRFYWDPYARS